MAGRRGRQAWQVGGHDERGRVYVARWKERVGGAKSLVAACHYDVGRRCMSTQRELRHRHGPRGPLREQARTVHMHVPSLVWYKYVLALLYLNTT